MLCGKVRSFHVPSVNAATLAPILREQIAADAHLMADESAQHTLVSREFASRGVVGHEIGEYVRGDIYSKTVEVISRSSGVD